MALLGVLVWGALTAVVVLVLRMTLRDDAGYGAAGLHARRAHPQVGAGRLTRGSPHRLRS
jgi:hypothetical protein